MMNHSDECLIFELCRPRQEKKVLEQNVSVSTALPCRVPGYEQGCKTAMAAIPTLLLAMFNVPQLEVVVKIMTEEVAY